LRVLSKLQLYQKRKVGASKSKEKKTYIKLETEEKRWGTRNEEFAMGKNGGRGRGGQTHAITIG